MMRRMKFRRIIAFMLVIIQAFYIWPNFNTAKAVKLPEVQYNDFSNVEQLQFNGDASQSGTEIIVSPAANDTMGTVFYKNKLTLQNENSFSTCFSFKLTDMYNKWGTVGGDGFTFVLQPISDSKIGTGTSPNGFGIIGIEPSMAVEFDTFQNSEFGDPSAYHIGVNTNGSNKSLATKIISTPKAGTQYYMWIDYNGLKDTIEIRYTDTPDRPINPMLIYSDLDLGALFSDYEGVYAGFSAASGGVYQKHIINAWHFDDEFFPMGMSDIERASRNKDALDVNDILNGNSAANNISTNLLIPISGEFGGNINWTSSNTSYITDDGTVTRPTRAEGNQTVTMTATFNDLESTTKNFVLTVVSMTDAEIVTADCDALTVGNILNGNTEANNILSNLSLPVTGENGSSIRWTSSNINWIELNGEVVRPAYPVGDQSVTLTASISCGAESTSKQFDLTVKRLEPSERALFEEDYNWLTVEKVLSTNGGVDKITSDLVFPVEAKNGSAITWSSGNSNYITDNGTVQRPNYTDGNQIVEIAATLSYGALEKTKFFSVCVQKNLPTDAEILAEDFKWLTVDRLLKENVSQYCLTGPLSLPIIAPNGTSIVWNFPDESPIANNGMVTRPESADGNASVTLTANLKKGDVSDTLTFNFTVMAKSDVQAPKLLSSAPAYLTPLYELKTVTFVFDEEIKSEDLNAIVCLKMTRGKTERIFGIPSISGNTLTIQIMGQKYEYDLRILIPKGTITDLSGNSYDELIQRVYYYRVKPPVLLSSNIENGEKNISLDTVISFAFNEAIKVDASKITLTCAMRPVPGRRAQFTDVSFDVEVIDKSLHITPQESLCKDCMYIIKVQYNAVSNSALKAAKPFSMAFYTVKVADAPRLIEYTTARYANTPCLLVFDRPVEINKRKIITVVSGRECAISCFAQNNCVYIMARPDAEVIFEEGAIYDSVNGKRAIYPIDSFWSEQETGWLFKRTNHHYSVNRVKCNSSKIALPGLHSIFGPDKLITVGFPDAETAEAGSKCVTVTDSKGRDVAVTTSVSGNTLNISRTEGGDWIPNIYHLKINSEFPVCTCFEIAGKTCVNFNINKTALLENDEVRISAQIYSRNFKYSSYTINGIQVKGGRLNSKGVAYTFIPDGPGTKEIILNVTDEFGYEYTYKQTIDVFSYEKSNTYGNVSRPDYESINTYSWQKDDPYNTSVTLQNLGFIMDRENVTATISKVNNQEEQEVLSQTQTTNYCGTAYFSFDIDSLESGTYIVRYSSPCALSLPSHTIRVINSSDLADLKIKLVDDHTHETVTSNSEIDITVNGKTYSVSKNASGQYVVNDLLPVVSNIKVLGLKYHYDETLKKELFPFDNEIVVRVVRKTPSVKPRIGDVTSPQLQRGGRNIFIDGVSKIVTFTVNRYYWFNHEPGQFEFIASIPDKNGNITEKKFYSKDGTLTIDVGRDLGGGATMSVRAVSKGGIASPSYDLNFEVAPRFPVGTVIASGDSYLINVSFDLTEMASASVPEDWPIIGGKTFGCDLGTITFGGIFKSHDKDGNNGVTFKLGQTQGILEMMNNKEKFNPIKYVVELSKSNRYGSYGGPGMDFGMKFDGQVRWEYRADENAWYFSNGAVKFAVNGELSYTQYYWLYIIPTYLRATLSAEASSLIEVDRPKDTFNVSGTLDVSPALEIAVGAGVEGLNVEGYLGGRVDTHFAFPSGNFSATGTVSGGARATALNFKWEKEAITYTWDIYQSKSRALSMMSPMNLVLAGSDAAPVSEDDFSLITRDVGSKSIWTANESTFEEVLSDATMQVMKNNVYSNAHGLLASYNGKTVLIWADDNPLKTSQNSTELYYSKLENGFWSEPQTFGLNGTADFMPDSTVGTDGFLTAWTDIKAVLPESTSLTNMLAAGEITTTYLTEDGSLADTQTLTNDAYYDSMAKTLVTNEGKMIVWVKNRHNSIFSLQDKAYDLYYSVNTGTGWSEATPIAGELDFITQLDARSSGGRTVLVYTIDNDNNINTDEDREVYSVVYENGVWSAPVQLTENSAADSNPRVAFYNGEEIIFWLSDGCLCMRNGVQGQTKLITDQMANPITSFELAQNDVELTAIVYASSGIDGIQSIDLLLYDAQEDTLSNSSSLISGKYLYSQLSPSFTVQDEIMVAFARTDVITETIDGKDYKNVGETDLAVITKQLKYDLRVSSDDIELMAGNGAPNSLNSVSVTVCNDGDYPEHNVTFRFTDSIGNPLSSDYTVPGIIPAHGSVTTEVEWIVPQDFTEDKIHVVVGSARPDADRTNNEVEFQIISYELIIRDITFTPAGIDTYSITAEIFNPCGRDLSGVKISLYQEGLSGTLIKTFSAADIPSGEIRSATVEVNTSLLFASDNSINVLAVAHNNKTAAKTDNGFWFEMKPESLRVSAVSPGDGAYNVPLDEVFELYFSQNIQTGITIDQISLIDTEGNTVAVTAAIDGNILRISHESDLSVGLGYILKIPVDAVQGVNGTTLTEAYELSFSTLLIDAFGVISSYPTNDMTEVELNDSITINFTNDIQEGDLFGDITVSDQNNTPVAITKQIEGSTLKLSPQGNWRSNTAYTVSVPEVSIYDTSDHPLLDSCMFVFKTETVASPGGNETDTTGESDNAVDSDGYMQHSSSGNFEIEGEAIETALNRQSGIEIEFSEGTIKFSFNFLQNQLQDVENITVSAEEKSVDNSGLPKGKTRVSGGVKFTVSVAGEPVIQTGGKMYIEIPVDTAVLKNPQKAIAYCLNDAGEWIPMGGVYDEKTNMLKVSTNKPGTYIVLEGDESFEDVTNTWSKEAIETLASREVINGTGENRFSPGASITRAEFTALIVRALYEGKAPNAGDYHDIPSNAWYAKEVQKCAELGLVNGTGNGNFSPNDPITREQICTILYRVINSYSNMTMEQNDMTFEDASDVSGYAKQAVQSLNRLGIVNGHNNLFRPLDSASREEAAVMIYRMLQAIKLI